LLLHQPLHQLRELQKVRQPGHCASFADGHLRIGCHFVGPLRWHRTDGLPVDLQQEPCAVPVVPPADAGKLPSAERVEWMRHAHKTRHSGRRSCILC
jgi:hypothetical protein